MALTVIAGPTASGKSALALALAEARPSVVINADSMQVYRELRVLTARPDAAAEARVPHRLYGVLSGGERCSAGRWYALAAEAVAEAEADGRQAILVGGTGLYLRAALEGLSPVPAVPADLRTALRERLEREGLASLHAELRRRDPATPVRPSDPQRTLRALEVLEATGRSLQDWWHERGRPLAEAARVALVAPPRQALHAACDRRFEAMVAAGALEEVRALVAVGLDPSLPVMKALGVPELAAHLRGNTALSAAIAAAQLATRRYAKRQATWIRSQLAPRAARPIVIEEQLSEKNIGSIAKKILPERLTE